MKKLAAIPMLLLAIIALLLPVASIAFSMDGYTLFLTYPNVTMAALTVATLVLSLAAISAKAGWFATLLAFLLPVFTALNCLFFLSEAPSVLTAVLAVICMLCVTVASLSCRRRVISFILILVMALLPLGAVGYLSYEIVTDPSLTEIANRPETILELASPEGNYTAVVGRAPHDGDFNTSIILHFNEEPMNFVVGRLQREPLLVHVMNWEDFDLADLKWIDESTLLCDGNTYAVTAEDVTLVETAEEAAEAIAEEIIPETAEEVIAEAAATEPSEASAADVVETPIVEATAEAAVASAAEPSEGTVDQPAEEADAETTAETVEETAVETELVGAVMG